MFFARTLISIAKVIQKQMDEELYDVKGIQSELTQLQLQLELGEIEEDVYDQKEKELLERLDKATQHNREI